MDRKVGWAAETPDLFSATFGPAWTGLRHYMVVEALPNGGWEWLTWANDGSGRCLHGTSDAPAVAMSAAERAAALLARIRHPNRIAMLKARVLN